MMVAISVHESTDTVQRFLPKGQAAARYGVIGFPTHVLIDDTGVVRAVVRGPLDAARVRRLMSLGEPTGRAPTR